MVPDSGLLVPPDPSGPISPSGKPLPELRERLRRVPALRNALSVVLLYAITIGIIATAVWLNQPVVWLVAFLAMGPMICRFNILMHEAAHRLLFANKRANDFVGKWFLGYPVMVPIDLYRRGHMAHHREEFGPNEPDIPLYRGYPMQRDSMRRKLTRDAMGKTGWKQTRGLFRAIRSDDPDVRRQAISIFLVQAVLLLVFVLAGHPWLYLLLWQLPMHTVWRVMNRLRSIAEHGGMKASSDRRETTHSVLQSWPARLTIVPYNTGWHLAHHVDAGIGYRSLPALHRELISAGYVQPGLEYSNYRTLWKTLSSG